MRAFGGVLAASSLVGQAAARPSPREIFERGLEIREQIGKIGPFEQHILNRGFKIDHQNYETFGFGNNSGDVSTNRPEPSDLTLFASVYTYDDISYALGNWEIHRDLSDAWNDFDDLPDTPNDAVGIGWEHSDYDLAWDTWDSDSHSSQRTATTNNIAWEFNDYAAYFDQADGSGLLCQGWSSVELDGTNPIGERSIIVNYQHTWTGGSITGVSFDSSGGMSIGVSIGTKKWATPKQAHSNDS